MSYRPAAIRDHRPFMPGEEMFTYRSAREQATQANILHEAETYLNIDGYLYSVVSLKELPDATFPGMLQNFSTLGFPVVIGGHRVIRCIQYGVGDRGLVIPLANIAKSRF